MIARMQETYTQGAQKNFSYSWSRYEVANYPTVLVVHVKVWRFVNDA